MPNRSKVNDPRFWARWRASGAVDTIDDATARQLANQGELVVETIGKHYAGPAKGYSALSLGKRTVNSGPGWRVTEPVLVVLVPGYDHQLGQEFSRLPRGYKSLTEVFPKG